MRFLIVFAVLALLGGYLGWHLWMLPPVAAWLRWLAVGVEALCLALWVLSMTRHVDRLPMGLASAVYNIGNQALIVIFYLLLLFLVADLLRLVHLLPTAWLRDNWITCAVLAVSLAGLFAYARLHYEHKQRETMSVDTHGRLERPMRVVAVSDLHLGYHNRRSDLARWVDMLNAEHPDLVLVAGDLIDRSLRPLLADDMAAELRRLDAPVYACLGNHEYFAGYYDSPAQVEQFYHSAGITLLRDSAAAVGPLVIVGRDDRSNANRLDLQRLLQQFAVADSQFTILLDHQPYRLDEAARAGIGLQLSGHTHRGQVWPLSWVTDAVYECSWGRLEKQGTAYYVSSGLGIWGAKYRIGTQSEYVVIELI